MKIHDHLKHLILIICGLLYANLAWTQTGIIIHQPSYILHSTEAITISINIENVLDDLRGYQVSVKFDPEYIDVPGAGAFQQGHFLSDVGLTSWNVSGQHGEYLVGCALLGLTNGAAGSGTLFTITLHPKKNTGPSGTDVILTDVVLRDPLNNPVPISYVGSCNIIIDAFDSYARIKAYLHGPYIIGGTMRHELLPYLPLTSPYDGQVIDALPDVSPRFIVDWVFVGLRVSVNGAIEQSQNAFILNDGFVVSLAGESLLTFSDLAASDYYITLRHRNHLGIMSAVPHHLPTSQQEVTTIDLTALNSVYGGNVLGVKIIEPGVLAMYAGDADRDGAVFNSDRNLYWSSQLGQSGYRSADFNMDGNVFNTDLNLFWRVNFGRQSQIPQ